MSGGALSNFVYSYDAGGNRLNVVEVDGSRVTWTYDAAYRLTREQRTGSNGFDVTYLYDSCGNRVTKRESVGLTTFTYDPAQQLLLEQAPMLLTTFVYDANGNLLEKNAGGQRTSYVWDSENRLVGVLLATGAVTTYVLDGDGRRRKRLSGAGTVQFIRDRDAVLQERDNTGSTLAQFTVIDAGVYEVISQRRGTARRFYHFDALGSVVQLTDPNQMITDAYNYSAFGELKASSGTTENSYRYLGGSSYELDVSTGLYSFLTKVYEPHLGRLVNSDYPDFLTSNGYVEGTPTNITAPVETTWVSPSSALEVETGDLAETLGAEAQSPTPVPETFCTRAEFLANTVVINVKVWDKKRYPGCKDCDWKEVTHAVRVHVEVQDEIQDIFQQIHDAPVNQRVPIHSIAPNSFRCKRPCERRFGAKKCVQMAATDRKHCQRCLSLHSQGLAFDLNASENPFYPGSTPPNPYWNCKKNPKRCCYGIRPGDVIHSAFTGAGWGWGGTWRNSKDYMHFSKTGK